MSIRNNASKMISVLVISGAMAASTNISASNYDDFDKSLFLTKGEEGEECEEGEEGDTDCEMETNSHFLTKGGEGEECEEGEEGEEGDDDCEGENS